MSTKTIEFQRAVLPYIENGVSILYSSGAGNHGIERYVMDFIDGLVIIDVVVSLEDGQYLARLFQDFSYLSRIADAVRLLCIQSLVHKDNRWRR